MTAVAAVYHMLSNEVALVRDFPVRPLDSLRTVYGLDGFSGTDVADVAESLAGSAAPDDLDSVVDLKTASDLVFWLDAVKAPRTTRLPHSLGSLSSRDASLGRVA